MGIVYVATGGQAINANSTKTQLVIIAPQDTVVKIRRVMFGQDGHNAGETVLLEMIGILNLNGGGTFVEPVSYSGAWGSGTTVISGPNEPDYVSDALLLQAVVNTAIGRDIVFEDGPMIGPNGRVGIRVTNRAGNTNITAPRCLVEFEELIGSYWSV